MKEKKEKRIVISKGKRNIYRISAKLMLLITSFIFGFLIRMILDNRKIYLEDILINKLLNK